MKLLKTYNIYLQASCVEINETMLKTYNIYQASCVEINETVKNI